MHRSIFALVVLSGGITFAQNAADTPGKHHLFRADQLPAPNATRSSDNPPRVVARPEGVLPQAPAGFTVNRFAGDLGGNNSPRLMTLAPNGDVFTTLSGDNSVVVLRDANHDGVADERHEFAGKEQGLNLPFGIQFHEEWLYVANTNGVVRFRYKPGQLKAEGPAETVIGGIPGLGYNQHWTRDILFSPDHKKLFVTVGSRTNLGEEEEMRAAIHEYNPDGTGHRRYAYGIRNPVGVAFNPVTRQLWSTCNERDELGDDLVPDFFTSVKEGGFYGWPYFYIGKHPDPRMRGKGAELARRVITPEVLFESHSAALGATFYTGKQFPREYRNDAFVAFHGSWNRAVWTGYKVVRVHFQNGKPTGGYDDFLTGFCPEPTARTVWGRPVGVAAAQDGALLVSDDAGHCIWRVSKG